MRYVIKAADGAYRGVADPTKTDDNSLSTWDVDDAVRYNSIKEAEERFRRVGKFSVKEGAKVVPVKTIEVVDG